MDPGPCLGPRPQSCTPAPHQQRKETNRNQRQSQKESRIPNMSCTLAPIFWSAVAAKCSKWSVLGPGPCLGLPLSWTPPPTGRGAVGKTKKSHGTPCAPCCAVLRRARRVAAPCSAVLRRVATRHAVLASENDENVKGCHTARRVATRHAVLRRVAPCCAGRAVCTGHAVLAVRAV